MIPRPILAVLLCIAALGLAHPSAAAEQARKKPHAAVSAPAPSRAGDLNSPATDFSGVSPIIEDPKVELLKPRKKKDVNFD